MCTLGGEDTLLKKKKDTSEEERSRGCLQNDFGFPEGFQSLWYSFTVHHHVNVAVRTVAYSMQNLTFLSKCGGGGGSLEITGALKLQLLNDLPAKPPNKHQTVSIVHIKLVRLTYKT